MPQPEINRRSLLNAAAIVAPARPVQAEAAAEVVALWPAAPPDGSGRQEAEQVSVKGR
jgi:hypothetical protein